MGQFEIQSKSHLELTIYRVGRRNEYEKKRSIRVRKEGRDNLYVRGERNGMGPLSTLLSNVISIFCRSSALGQLVVLHFGRVVACRSRESGWRGD
jgi:hypothetical protein